jgi:hypothetical protein
MRFQRVIRRVNAKGFEKIGRILNLAQSILALVVLRGPLICGILNESN